MLCVPSPKQGTPFIRDYVMLPRASCVAMGLPTIHIILLCSSLDHLWESHLTNGLAQMHAASEYPANGI